MWYTISMSSLIDIGTYVHAIKRGGRGLPIVKDDADRYRFLKCLYFLNDSNHPSPWERDVNAVSSGLHFERPDLWEGEREPLVAIHAYCLMDNHFHLLLEEIREEGIPKFLRSLSRSMTNHFNDRYDGQGSIFQGDPKYRVIEDESYLVNAQLYITVKNPMERFAGGLRAAIADFDAAYEFACSYPFCSLADHIGDRDSPIIHSDSRSTHTPEDHRELAREFMRGGEYRYWDKS